MGTRLSPRAAYYGFYCTGLLVAIFWGLWKDRSDTTGEIEWGWYAARVIISPILSVLAVAKIPWLRRLIIDDDWDSGGSDDDGRPDLSCETK